MSNDTGVTRIVINECYGGFSLSEAASKELGAHAHRDIGRDDPRLVEIVERLGKEANGRFADLTVVEIPAGVKWHVHEYDGLEAVHEEHRTWPGGETGTC